jgi:hypothetical protein
MWRSQQNLSLGSLSQIGVAMLLSLYRDMEEIGKMARSSNTLQQKVQEIIV